MTTEQRIELLTKLGNYILSDDETWQQAQYRAIDANAWFTQESIDLAAANIAQQFLDHEKLESWLRNYTLPAEPKKVGIVMAGNIPLVGFHDFLCGFVSGHQLHLKLSSKDEILLKHLIGKLVEWQPAVNEQVHISDRINGCEAYIATGSNNTARYFEQYFGKYPHIIRQNRTSVAVLDGTETKEEMQLLAKDIFTYFGLGCRNVTQLYLPQGYDMEKLPAAFSIYEDLINHNKYKNNYDYYLAIYLLNKVPYLNTGSLLLIENEQPFSAVAVLHYKFYTDKADAIKKLQQNNDIQCIVGHSATNFGEAQKPSLSDYADGVDTMDFLCKL